MIEVEEEVHLEKEKSEELARRELIPRVVINTWDAVTRAPADLRVTSVEQ